MTPIDLRNETWESIQSRVTGQRLMVLHAWRVLGRGTTRQLASHAHIDILNVRPRTTELVQLGLVRLVASDGTEGVYEPLPEPEARAMFAERRKAFLRGEYQPELKLL
jgi:hypothetical protein